MGERNISRGTRNVKKKRESTINIIKQRNQKNKTKDFVLVLIGEKRGRGVKPSKVLCAVGKRPH